MGSAAHFFSVKAHASPKGISAIKSTQKEISNQDQVSFIDFLNTAKIEKNTKVEYIFADRKKIHHPEETARFIAIPKEAKAVLEQYHIPKDDFIVDQDGELFIHEDALNEFINKIRDQEHAPKNTEKENINESIVLSPKHYNDLVIEDNKPDYSTESFEKPSHLEQSQSTSENVENKSFQKAVKKDDSIFKNDISHSVSQRQVNSTTLSKNNDALESEQKENVNEKIEFSANKQNPEQVISNNQRRESTNIKPNRMDSIPNNQKQESSTQNSTPENVVLNNTNQKPAATNSDQVEDISKNKKQESSTQNSTPEKVIPNNTNTKPKPTTTDYDQVEVFHNDQKTDNSNSPKNSIRKFNQSEEEVDDNNLEHQKKISPSEINHKKENESIHKFVKAHRHEQSILKSELSNEEPKPELNDVRYNSKNPETAHHEKKEQNSIKLEVTNHQPVVETKQDQQAESFKSYKIEQKHIVPPQYNNDNKTEISAQNGERKVEELDNKQNKSIDRDIYQENSANSSIIIPDVHQSEIKNSDLSPKEILIDQQKKHDKTPAINYPKIEVNTPEKEQQNVLNEINYEKKSLNKKQIKNHENELNDSSLKKAHHLDGQKDNQPFEIEYKAKPQNDNKINNNVTKNDIDTKQVIQKDYISKEEPNTEQKVHHTEPVFSSKQKPNIQRPIIQVTEVQQSDIQKPVQQAIQQENVQPIIKQKDSKSDIKILDDKSENTLPENKFNNAHQNKIINNETQPEKPVHELKENITKESNTTEHNKINTKRSQNIKHNDFSNIPKTEGVNVGKQIEPEKVKLTKNEINQIRFNNYSNQSDDIQPPKEFFKTEQIINNKDHVINKSQHNVHDIDKPFVNIPDAVKEKKEISESNLQFNSKVTTKENLLAKLEKIFGEIKSEKTESFQMDLKNNKSFNIQQEKTADSGLSIKVETLKNEKTPTLSDAAYQVMRQLDENNKAKESEFRQHIIHQEKNSQTSNAIHTNSAKQHFPQGDSQQQSQQQNSQLMHEHVKTKMNRQIIAGINNDNPVAPKVKTKTGEHDAVQQVKTQNMQQTNGQSSHQSQVQAQNGAQSTAATQEVNKPSMAEQYTEQIQKLQQSANQQIVSGVKGIIGSERSHVNIQLTPESLGKVSVQLTFQNGQLTAQLQVDKDNTRIMMERNISSLRSALDEAGIKVERVVITKDNADNRPQDSHKDNSQDRSRQERQGNSDQNNQQNSQGQSQQHKWFRWAEHLANMQKYFS